ncbi:hypothetical protein FJ365_00260 [Candidatus Dependentiae bacterium]|nr:hypothetical protein [Candidatus Dependentiae bacterium]
MNFFALLLTLSILFSTNNLLLPAEESKCSAEEVLENDYASMGATTEDKTTLETSIETNSISCLPVDLFKQVISFLEPNKNLWNKTAMEAGLIPSKDYFTWAHWNSLAEVWPKQTAAVVAKSIKNITPSKDVSVEEVEKMTALLCKAFSCGYKILADPSINEHLYSIPRTMIVTPETIAEALLDAVRFDLSNHTAVALLLNNFLPSDKYYFTVLNVMHSDLKPCNKLLSKLLITACGTGSRAYPLVKALLTFKADPNALFNRYYALDIVHPCSSLVKLLIEHGACANATMNDTGQTILHRICAQEAFLRPSNALICRDIAQYVLAHGAIASLDMVTKKNSPEMVALIHAAVARQRTNALSHLTASFINTPDSFYAAQDRSTAAAASVETICRVEDEEKKVRYFFKTYRTIEPLSHNGTPPSFEDLESIYQLFQTATSAGVKFVDLLQKYSYNVAPAALAAVQLPINTPEAAEAILTRAVTGENPILFFMLLRALQCGVNPNMCINGKTLLSILITKEDHLSIMLLDHFGLDKDTPVPREERSFEPLEEALEELALQSQEAPRRSAKDRCRLPS